MSLHEKTGFLNMPKIYASARSADDNFETLIDARPYLVSLDAAGLHTLMEGPQFGEQPLRDIVDLAAENICHAARTLKAYCAKTEMDYGAYLNPVVASAWLTAHRPELAAAVGLQSRMIDQTSGWQDLPDVMLKGEGQEGDYCIDARPWLSMAPASELHEMLDHDGEWCSQCMDVAQYAAAVKDNEAECFLFYVRNEVIAGTASIDVDDMEEWLTKNRPDFSPRDEGPSFG